MLSHQPTILGSLQRLRAFSLKANDVPAVVARLGGLGLGANVVSRGEWAVARAAGIPN